MTIFRKLCLAALLTTVALTAKGFGATVGYFRFEEGTTGAQAGGSATVLDSSGYGSNATAVSGPVYTANVPASFIPQIGAADTLALRFNGNQRIAIPDTTALALTHSLTLEAYVFPLNTTSYQQIVMRGDDRVALDPYYLAIQSNTLQLHIADAAGNVATISAPFGAVGKWSEVAGTLDDTTGAMTLYINGVSAATRTTTVRPFATLDPTQTPGLGIGNVQSGTYGEYFTGSIDEVRISDQALLPGQLLSAIPEPASIAMLVSGAMALLRRSKRHSPAA